MRFATHLPLSNSVIQLSKIILQNRMSFTASRVLWTYLALGRRSSTATLISGRRWLLFAAGLCSSGTAVCLERRHLDGDGLTEDSDVPSTATATPGRRSSSAATTAPGCRSSSVSATPKWCTQLRARVQTDGKCVCLPLCSLRYAKSKPEANRLRGGTIVRRGWTIHPRWGGKGEERVGSVTARAVS